MHGTTSVGERPLARDAGDPGSAPTADATTGLASLSRLFALLVGIVWVLIVLGALVRANDAGLACPDWPLCFGELVPRLDVRVAFEYFHRVLAGIVTLAFLGLGWRAWRSPAVASSTRRLVALAGLLLGIQILLGALTVWELLASWTVTSHLVTGNAVAVSLLLVAVSLRETAAPVARLEPVSGAVRTALLAGCALLVLQIVLGGLVSSRYAGLTCPDWPTCHGGVWFPTFEGPTGLHLLHRLNAYALALVFGVAAFLCRGHSRLGGLCLLLFALVAAQAGVGIANVLLRLPVEVTGLHSALAAALVLLATLALRETFAARSAAC